MKKLLITAALLTSVLSVQAMADTGPCAMDTAASSPVNLHLACVSVAPIGDTSIKDKVTVQASNLTSKAIHFSQNNFSHFYMVKNHSIMPISKAGNLQYILNGDVKTLRTNSDWQKDVTQGPTDHIIAKLVAVSHGCSSDHPIGTGIQVSADNMLCLSYAS